MARENVLAEVKSLAPHDQFVIALHSPSGLVETGLPVSGENGRKACPGSSAGHFLRSVYRENRRITAFSSDSWRNVAWFLYTPDWVAERVGFGYHRFPQLSAIQTDSDITQCSCGFASTLNFRLPSIPYTLFAPVRYHWYHPWSGGESGWRVGRGTLQECPEQRKTASGRNARVCTSFPR